MILVGTMPTEKIYFLLEPINGSDGVVVRDDSVVYVPFWSYYHNSGKDFERQLDNEFLKLLWSPEETHNQDWIDKFLTREKKFSKRELRQISPLLVKVPKEKFSKPVFNDIEFDVPTKEKKRKPIKQQVRRRVLPKKKSMAGRIEFKAVNKPNKPNLPNTPRKPSLGGGGSSKPRALKPAVFDPRSADADGDGWRQEGTTARWYGVGLNSPIVESLRSEMRLIQGNAYHDLTGMANLNQSYFADAPPPLGSTLEADLAWLGGKLSLASVVNPGMTEGRWLVGREQVRKQTEIREGVLPTPDISELSDSDILKNLEQIIDTRKKARVAKDAKTRVAAPDNVSDEALAAARDFDVDTADPSNIDADAKAMFNFEFIGMDGEKYSAEIQRSYLQNVKYEDGSSPRRLAINGKIFKDGKEVGFFDRTIYPDTKTVSHDHMHLDDEVRGAQISGIINARNELIYRSLGCDVITTKASSNIGYNGATHWPKVGFDWQDDYNREVYFASVDSALTQFALGIDKDPDTLPMMQKLDPKSGMFAFIPIFSSREEAEEVALLLTLARTQSMDDPDRLTAGDLVNWSGAESWFQVNAIEGGLVRSIGGQEELADVPEVVEPDLEVAELPGILQESYEDELTRSYTESIKLYREKNGSLEGFDTSNVRGGLDGLHRRNNEKGYDPIEQMPYLRFKDANLEEPDLETGSMADDILYIFEYNKAVEDSWNRRNSLSGPPARTLSQSEQAYYLHGRQAQRRKLAQVQNAKGTKVGDYEIDETVVPEFKDVPLTELEPSVSDFRIKDSEMELTILQEEMIERLTAFDAAWRELRFTDLDGKEVLTFRGGSMPTNAEVKAAIAHNLGQMMAENLETEEMIGLILAMNGVGFGEIKEHIKRFGTNSSDSTADYATLAVTAEGRILTDFELGVSVSATLVSPSSENYKKMLGEYIADHILSGWAASSDSGLSLHVQDSVARVFGLDGVDGVREMDKSELALDPRGSYPEIFDEFVKAQYVLTQSMFAKAEVDKVVTHRGMIWGNNDSGPLGTIDGGMRFQIKDAEVSLQPLSSTAYERGQTRQFSDAQTLDTLSVIVHSDTPVARILSTALTGVGCLEETELTLIGGGATRFDLETMPGDNVLSEGSGVVSVVVDSHRRGEKITKMGLSEQLKNAGFSPEEIKKIRNYMSEEGMDLVPTIAEIDSILRNDEEGLAAAQMWLPVTPPMKD